MAGADGAATVVWYWLAHVRIGVLFEHCFIIQLFGLMTASLT